MISRGRRRAAGPAGEPEHVDPVMQRAYRYVGPKDLMSLATSDIARCEPRDPAELLRWLREQGLTAPMTLTYVVTADGALRVSPRNAEHVACARGESVVAAGELTLGVVQDHLHVQGVTNQSTGYCPEASCFLEVASALKRLGLEPPTELTHEFIFRRCTSCQTIAIVKEDDFECASCGAELPRSWNLDACGPSHDQPRTL
jgi:hypothetical protein